MTSHRLPRSADVEYPVIGEPLGVELANTRYGTGSDAVDFLDTDVLARGWMREVLGSAGVDDLVLLRELRDAVHAALAAHANGETPAPRVIATVNRHAAAGCATAVLQRTADDALTAGVRYHGAGATRARLATSCIEVLTGPHPVRRCEGVGCTLFFVQQHGRRRFCSDECSHRLRQQRYYRSTP